VFPLKEHAKRFEFQDIAKQPIGRIINYRIEGLRLPERIGNQLFKTLPLFHVAIGSLALINICLRYRISVLFRPLTAFAELRLDGLILFIQGCPSCPRINDGRFFGVLLFCLSSSFISFELFRSDY
jgi:hypothetical protein